MDVLIHPSAEKMLNKLATDLQQKIKSGIKKLSEDPYSKQLDVKKLKGLGNKPDLFRLRVGEYRIIYAIKEDKLWVTDILKREKGYHF
jgi:mRNA interferase RelE/StbE